MQIKFQINITDDTELVNTGETELANTNFRAGFRDRFT